MKRFVLILSIGCLLAAVGCRCEVASVLEPGPGIVRNHCGWVLYNDDGWPVVGSLPRCDGPHGGPIVVAKPKKSWHPVSAPWELR